MCDQCTRRSMLLIVNAMVVAAGSMGDQEERAANIGHLFAVGMPEKDMQGKRRDEDVERAKQETLAFCGGLTTATLVELGQDCDQLEDCFGAFCAITTALIAERAGNGDRLAQSALGRRLPPEVAVLLNKLMGQDAEKPVAPHLH